MKTGERQDGTGPASLQIRLLGTPEVSLDGTPVAGLSSAKAQALLSHLAVSARPHTRPALATLLWGDFPDSAARGNLPKALHHLRSKLEGYLVIDAVVVAYPGDLGRLESDPARAQLLGREARQVIDTIASQIDREDLKRSFLKLARKWLEAG